MPINIPITLIHRGWNFIQDFLAKYSSAVRWIGVIYARTDLDIDNHNETDNTDYRFEFIDGSPLDYSNWYTSIENFTPLSPWEACVGMYRSYFAAALYGINANEIYDLGMRKLKHNIAQ